MIDLSKEILKFEKKKIDDYKGDNRHSLFDFIEFKDITENSYKLNKKIYIELNNLQNKNSEILNQLNEKDEEIHNLKNENYELNKEIAEVVKSLIELSDQILNIYKFSKSTSQENWSKSLEKVVEKTGDILSRAGLSRIKCDGEVFDYNIHECKGVKEVKGIDKDVIVDVLREGYRLKGKIIRNPEVIISK